MQDDDASYYQRRVESETILAERAKQPEVVAVHRQLASLYLKRLKSTGGTGTNLG